jgi:hypothetical protein
LGTEVYRRQAPHRSIAVENERAAAEQRRAALAYIAWPVALYEELVEREASSEWFRFHVRQALGFGLIASLAGFAALLWPLVLSLFVGNVTATVVFYTLALLLDIALVVVWLVRAIGYSKQAARGTTFEISIVAVLNRRVRAKR